MSFEEHCVECQLILGASFAEVHLWLDEFAGAPGIGMKHRCRRHHRAGIEEARRLFGQSGAQAALLHVISDYKEEGWRPGCHFPDDELDYRKTGLF